MIIEQANYSLLLSKDNDINVSFIDINGCETSYSPVIFAIYKKDNDIIFFTENKTGELKHAYNINKHKFIDIDILENEICQIIDYQRF